MLEFTSVYLNKFGGHKNAAVCSLYIDKFDMRAFRQNHIYTDIWGYEDEADLIKDDLRNSFENLKKFYEKMAAQESAVLVSFSPPYFFFCC